VRQIILEADARVLQRTLYVQVLRPFAALNFGNPDLAPTPKWNVSPPEDQETKARTLQAFGQGLNQMRLAGIRVKDPVRFARTFGLKLEDIEHVDPVQVEARLAGATGKVEQAEDGGSDDADKKDKPAGKSKSGAPKPVKPTGIKPVKPVRPLRP
jgi:hypothetical protein